ncbi:hypothetical protein [Companilactobacillus hulinensis]|uniref:hypothetical protein n=1 Tax=Companilactobacillus hulinensis TaxID=2486007 RepID=UPI0013DE5234|nr:hypothetical protein [Companilactobacillus hulinensis]
MRKRTKFVSVAIFVMLLIFLLADTSWYNYLFLKIGGYDVLGSFVRSFRIIRHLLSL